MILDLLLSWTLWFYGFVAIAAYVAFWYAREFYLRKSGKVPDGPYGVPILGFLPFVGSQMHVTFQKQQEIYGPIMYTRLGSKPTYFLNRHEDIKEAQGMRAFFGRSPSSFGEILSSFPDCASFFVRTADAGWRTCRKIAVKGISLYTSSKNSSLDPIVQKASGQLVERLKETEGSKVEMKGHVLRTCSAIMSSICFGIETDLDHELGRLAEKNTLANSGVMFMLAFLLDLLEPPKILMRPLVNHMAKPFQELGAYCLELVNKHRGEGEKVVNILDAVRKAGNELDEATLQAHDVSRKQVEMLAFDMYLGGIFDVPENTDWLMFLLSHHPEIQERIQREVDEVTGGVRRPCLADQEHMVYTMATVYECLRWVTTTAFFPRAAMEDTVFHGFTIPKDAEVSANWWAANHDPTVYPEPMAFRPERYILENGQFNAHLASLLFTFGSGGRRCVGEPLAKQIMFMIGATVLQNFSLKCEMDEPTDEPLEPVVGLALVAKPHKLIFTSR